MLARRAELCPGYEPMIAFAPAPQIDYSRLSFPSDALTVGQLRKSWPKPFNTFGHGVRMEEAFHDGVSTHLYSLVSAERELAKLVFDVALGRYDDEKPDVQTAEDTRWSISECLISDYTRYGLAHGRHHAEQQIRDLEAAAEAQVRAHLGPQK
jgi:hypothetical protein